MVGRNLGMSIRMHISVSTPINIFFYPYEPMRFVPDKIRLHEVVGDDLCFLGAGSDSFENLAYKRPCGLRLYELHSTDAMP